MAIPVFIAYARADEPFRKELVKHLALLEKQEGLISIWHDGLIEPSAKWEAEIEKHLLEARLIVFLVSADFFHSEYCHEKEMKLALERHERGEARVVPVIVRACLWQSSRIAHIQFLPADAKPVDEWAKRDAAWVDVVNGIRAAVLKLREEDQKGQGERTDEEAQRRERERALANYEQEFSRVFDVPEMVPVSLSLRDVLLSSDDFLAKQPLENSFLIGPSGCGKSLLGRRLAKMGLDYGYVPVFMAAKYFDGNFESLLSRSVEAFTPLTGTDLLNASKREERRILLVADGCNECPAMHREALKHALMGIRRRYPAVLVASGQRDEDIQGLGDIDIYRVEQPDANIKRRIAVRSAGRELDDAAAHELDALLSCLDAEVFGATVMETRPNAGRLARFNLYTRKRLGGDPSAITPLNILVDVAGAMDARLSMYLSLPEYNRITTRLAQYPEDALRRVVESGLVEMRSNRLSFRHELFQRFFLAEFLARQMTDVVTARKTLDEPRWKELRTFLMGVVADRPFCGQVVRSLDDAQLLQDCYDGLCGSEPRCEVLVLRDEMLGSIRAEVEGLRFGFNESEGVSSNAVELARDSVREWTPSDRAVQSLVGRTLRDDASLDAMLEVVKSADECLAKTFIALSPEAKRRGIALRSDLFRELYVMTWANRAAGIGEAIASLNHFSGSGFRIDSGAILRRLTPDRSPGQLYVLLKLLRRSKSPDPDEVAERINALIGQVWRVMPYHLRLEVLYSVPLSRHAGDEFLTKLIATVKTLLRDDDLLWNSIVFDALDGLGTFDDEGDASAIVEQIRTITLNPDDELNRSMAADIFSSQFDHPYSHAYFEAISSLEPALKANFLVMAALSSCEDAFGLATILRQIVQQNDRACEPALRYWARQLPARTVICDPPAQFAALMLAHIGLARLRLAPESHTEPSDTPAGLALRACGALAYWIFRDDAPDDARRHCEEYWRYLLQHELGVGANALMLLEASDWRMTGFTQEMSSGSLWKRLLDGYGGIVGEICRVALRQPETQRNYFQELYDGLLSREVQEWQAFCIRVLGMIGRDSDLPLLRSFALDPHLAVSALKAVAQIDAREL